MPIISGVKFSQIKDRMDAEYYRSEYIGNEKFLTQLSTNKKITVRSLGEIAEIRGSAFYGPIKFDYTSEGIPFIRVTEIKDFTINRSDLVYLPEGFDKYEQQIATIHAGWIVISKSGTTFGSIGIVPENMTTCKISRDVLGIKSKINMSSEYMATFLTSKYGQLQIKRCRSLQAQPHLEIKKVKEILIPILPKSIQNNITETIKSSQKKRQEAEEKYSKVENQLLELLGVNIYNNKKEKRFKINFSELENGLGWNAENHLPEYSQILEELKKKNMSLEEFGKNITISKRKVCPELEPTRFFNYIELSNISSFGFIDGFSTFTGHEAPSRAEMLLRHGDVLIPYLRGSFDKIGIVTEEFENFIGSTGFYVVRSRKYDSWFLFTLLRSSIFQKQLAQRISGTIMQSVPLKLLRTILLPEVSKENQANISETMKEAYVIKKQSEDLSKKAIELIEINLGQKSEACAS
jgi:restriction endonuclease S subunit